MKCVVSLFLTLFILTAVFGQKKKTSKDKTVEMIGLREVLPIISKSCENADENCTKEALIKFISSFEFETSDTTKFNYKCYVGFIVEANCSISNIVMKRSNGTCDFDEQVLEHFGYLPNFYKPGYQMNKPVPISYVVPLVYTKE